MWCVSACLSSFRFVSFRCISLRFVTMKSRHHAVYSFFHFRFVFASLPCTVWEANRMAIWKHCSSSHTTYLVPNYSLLSHSHSNKIKPGQVCLSITCVYDTCLRCMCAYGGERRERSVVCGVWRECLCVCGVDVVYGVC